MAVLHQTLLSQPVPDPLTRFDLSEEEIYQRVIYPAVIAAEGVSPLAPPGARGRRMYDEGVTGLRQVLLPKTGWEMPQDDGVARTANDQKRLAIVFARGNVFTGMVNGQRDLTTEWDKGPRAFANADRYVEAGFEALDDSFPAAPAVIGKWNLWYLLYRQVEEELRLELSRPGFLDASGYPRMWIERIILEPFSLKTDIVIDEDDEDDGGTGAVEVPVKKR
ncbi:hypothetical protein [Nocardia wallacei]|uniref:hypothetical protein n=1 Tax=Nocardia wallacei TaxID=480035 RepID=UPI002457501E|nr:hypothetical protein [Nocardia wallacei]